MKRVLIFQALFLAVIGLGLYFYGARQEALSFIVGGFIVTGNFILLGTGWNMVFNKKLVALSVLIIVFKYAILGVIIYVVVKQIWLLPIWFAGGIASMMMASLMYGLTLGFFKEE
jgi:hypothetical protein